jgi:hypothetical protein
MSEVDFMSIFALFFRTGQNLKKNLNTIQSRPVPSKNPVACSINM